MKKLFQTLCMVLLAFAMFFGMAGGLAEPAWAAAKVAGGATRETATEIACNEKYTVHLSGTDATYFKFTTPASDFSRVNVWLNIPKVSKKYSGKIFAFFGSAERVDNPDHKKWDSTVYGEKFPLLFCSPATTYYLWICGGKAGREGDITFQMIASDDDAGNVSSESQQATPLTLSRKVEATIDRKAGSELTKDYDNFSFKTGSASVYGITVRYKEARKGEEYSDFEIYAKLYEMDTSNLYESWGTYKGPTLKEIGGFSINEGKTGKFKIELEENQEYLLELSPTGFRGEPKSYKYYYDVDADEYVRVGGDEEEEEEEEPIPALYGTYALRVDAVQDKPWEIQDVKPTSVTLSKKVSGEFLIETSYLSAEPAWYSFTTGKAGRYRVTTKREKAGWLEEGVINSDLRVVVYDASGKRLGGYSVKEGKTEKASFKLKEKTKYHFKVFPADYDYKLIGESPYDPDTSWYVWAAYSCLVAEEPDLANAAVTYTKKWTYAGKAVKPTVKVTYGKTTLVKGADYTVAYANNKKPGKGKITITGAGKYGGSKTVYFAIYPKKQVISSLKSTKAKKATVKIQEDASVTGYQICYSLTKDFKKSKTVASATATKTLSLTSGKTYYVRVRGVAKYGSKEIYGAWSEVKSVKVK